MKLHYYFEAEEAHLSLQYNFFYFNLASYPSTIRLDVVAGEVALGKPTGRLTVMDFYHATSCLSFLCNFCYNANEVAIKEKVMDTMDTPMKALSSEQMTLLFENHELLDALLKLTESDGFKSVFSEMSLDEVMSRYESTLHFDDVESDTVLRERYLRMRNQESNDDMLKKLRAKSLFDDSDNE